MLHNEELARDAMQDIFVKVFLRLDSYAWTAAFSSWIYRVSHNYCIDFLRWMKKQRKVFSNETFDIETLEDMAGSYEDSFGEELFGGHISEEDLFNYGFADARLSDRMILEYKYYDGLQIKEIAALLWKSESAVKMRIKRAKEMVRGDHDDPHSDEILWASLN